MMHFQKIFSDQLNCVMVSEWACDCGMQFLTNWRAKASLKCPACGKQMEATGTLTIASKTCKHEYGKHGHSINT